MNTRSTREFLHSRCLLEMQWEDENSRGICMLSSTSSNNNCEEKNFERNADVLYKLAVAQEKGSDGFQQDYKQAFELYSESASMDHPAAMAALANMYWQGKGVPQNYELAADFFTKAAEKGHVAALHSLGFMYHHSLGVAKDLDKAIMFYRQGAEKGDAEAINSLGFMHHHGIGVVQDYKKSFELFHQAASLGNATALNNLASLYQDGKYIDRDHKKAVELYRQSAEKGYYLALSNLRHMYQSHQSRPYIIYHVAIILSEPDMLDKFNMLAVSDAEAFDALLEENPQDTWEKIKPLLKSKIAKQVYKRIQKNTTAIGYDLIRETPLNQNSVGIILNLLKDNSYLKDVDQEIKIILSKQEMQRQQKKQNAEKKFNEAVARKIKSKFSIKKIEYATALTDVNSWSDHLEVTQENCGGATCRL